jgi:PleD family two-component response regulator
METIEFRKLNVLIVSHRPDLISSVRTALKLIGCANVESIADFANAIKLLSHERFDVVFTDDFAKIVNEKAFVLALRTSVEILNPTIPVIGLMQKPSKSQIELGRDLGVNDMIACPISAATIGRKLCKTLISPREFVVAKSFFGPDRRARHLKSSNERRKSAKSRY